MNRNAESVGEWLRRRLREHFQSSRVVSVGTGIPGLMQPWAEITQRFQRTSYTGDLRAHIELHTDLPWRSTLGEVCDPPRVGSDLCCVVLITMLLLPVGFGTFLLTESWAGCHSPRMLIWEPWKELHPED